MKSLPNSPLEFQTAFNNYRIEDRYYNGRPARVLYSGDGIAALSGIAKDDDPELVFDYNECFRGLVQGIQPAQLLLLGGGVFTLPSALIRQFPKLRQDVVEIDGELAGIAKQYFDFKPNRRTKVHIGDGRQFLDKTSTTYDLIVIDVFDNATIPASFQTPEFVQSLQRRLNQNGVVAINVIASLSGLRSKNIRHLRKLLQAVFPVVQVFPATTGLSAWTSQNFVLIGQDGSWDTAAHLGRAESELPPI